MMKLLKELTERIQRKRPYKTKVVCESIDGENKFTLYYKRFRVSRYRYVIDSNGEPVRYDTYLEAAAAAYMASITSMKFFNNV